MPASNKSSQAQTAAFHAALGANRSEISATTSACTTAIGALEAMLEFRSEHVVDDTIARFDYVKTAGVCGESLITARHENGGKPLARAFGTLRENYTKLNNYYDPSKISYAEFTNIEKDLQANLDDAMNVLKRTALASWFAADPDHLGSVAPEVLEDSTEVDKIWDQGYNVISK
jgi:hypothetical protein